ncbi:MAG: hypothetical protein ABJV04_05225 [Aliiglaciecola sp.]|uniref:hypothetical protein n=1 Tax=Aliiglaciecola sp. TaxID=1872441 RepID=UPI003296B539
MKNKTLIKAAMLTFALSTTVAATSANAGSKQKPPIAVEETSSWYGNILDFFS